MPVVYDDTDAAASAVIRNRAAELSCPAYPISPAVYTDLRREHGGMILMIKEKSQRLFIPFEAEYQAVNACIAYQAARLLAVDGETAAAGIRNAVWHGRMEEIQDGVYLDGATMRAESVRLWARRQRWQRAEEKSPGKMVGFSAVCSRFR